MMSRPRKRSPRRKNVTADDVKEHVHLVIEEFRDDRAARRDRSHSDPAHRTRSGRGPRNRAHDVLDVAFELVELLRDAVGDLGDSVVDRIAPAAGTGPRQPAMIVLPATAPGKQSKGSLVVENMREGWVDDVRLRCTDLAAAGATHIPARHVKFNPSTPFDVAGGDERKVAVTIDVPRTAKKGWYVGQVQVVGTGDVTAMLCLEVR